MINKARQASEQVLRDDSVTLLSQQPKNSKNHNNNDVVTAMQTLIKAGVINIGVTVIRLNRLQRSKNRATNGSVKKGR